MAKNVMHDNSTGEVVIRPGPPISSGGGGGFFSIGGGGGFGGGFAQSSKKRRKKHARARAAALAQARAQEQARQEALARAHAEMLAAAHRQQVQAYSQAREGRREQLDVHFADQAQSLAQALEQEVQKARRPPQRSPDERWQLYQITKARGEIDGLIAAKQQSLMQHQALAASFPDAGMPADAYGARLAGLADAQQMLQMHQGWEAAYTAAADARLLEEAISQLSQRSAALAAEHAQQKEIWRARDAEREAQRQYAEQREARVRFKREADEDRRLQRLKHGATLTAPVAAAASGGVLLGQAGAQVAAQVAAAIEQAIANAVKETLRVAAIRVGQTVSLTATAMLYSPMLGDGELSQAQRRRHLEGVGVRADLLGIRAGQDLQAIADAGGTALLGQRIKIEHLPEGSAIAVASTGAGIASDVRVRNALFDPVSETYRVEAQTPTEKTLVLGGAALEPGSPTSGGVLALVPEAFDIGAGVDLRFDDCIVCIPGQPPQYFSFSLTPAGTGVVSGSGEASAAGWWPDKRIAAGVPVPAQVGDQLRGRSFTGMPAFEGAVWRAIAADQGLLGQFDEVNQRRILSGFAPVAPRETWRGARHHFELRHVAPAGVGSGLYDLDRRRIHTPSDTQGVLTVVQPFEPWFASSVALAFDTAIVEGQPRGTWTPLVAPGAELLGSTLLPVAPPLPDLLPGVPIAPVEPSIEILPGENPDDIGAIIPGFGGDTELPQPGLVNNEPAKPLEVGEYKDLRRRSVNDRMDVDHIVSRKAYQHFLVRNFLQLSPAQLKALLEAAPSIVIPAEVHRKYSETYGGRNTRARQISDAADLRAAVDSNVAALTPGLIDYGFTEEEIENARQQLHDLHQSKGLY